MGESSARATSIDRLCIPQDRTHGFYGSAVPTGIVVFTSDSVFLYDFLIQLWLISQNRINTCSKATKLFFLWKLVFQDSEVLEYPLLFLPCDIDWEPGPHNCVSTQPGKISKFTGWKVTHVAKSPILFFPFSVGITFNHGESPTHPRTYSAVPLGIHSLKD